MIKFLLVSFLFIFGISSMANDNPAMAYIELDEGIKQRVQKSLKVSLADYMVNALKLDFPEFDDDIYIDENKGQCFHIQSLGPAYSCVLEVNNDINNGIASANLSVIIIEDDISISVLNYESGGQLE